ncbi:MAG TPA: hypothetical protein PK373_00760 [Sedimentisphaerales bacterium]|nr:hypothetical protein [Sedimentisphaerales bacterium]HQI28304.1 hypothetical protein [Sedimentisphaerales bacterium]
MIMKRILWVLSIVGTVCTVSLQAAPVSYVGKLAHKAGAADGLLFVTGSYWLSSWAFDTTLSWKVDNTTTPGMWHYEYKIEVPDRGGLAKDIQCIIIEASNGSSGPPFTIANLHSLKSSPENWIQSIDVGLHSPTDNPNLPRNLYGIRLATANIDPKTLTISFDTDRAPVWGDFYARSYVLDGDFCAFYNYGLFYTPESDPLDPPSNGSILNHVLVPDSIPMVLIPAPAAMLLSILGLPLAGWLRRHQSL